MKVFLPATLGAAIMAIASPANADDDAFELWLNPSFGTQLDDNTGIEFETAQRFRSAGDGRSDSYFGRLWLLQDLTDDITLGGAIEQRINDGGSDETRVMQQLSISHGLWKTRLRLEERFVDGTGRMGLRLRPRLGIELPLGADTPWSFEADHELGLTLKSNRPGGDDGLTSMRTQIGFNRDLNDTLSLSVAYLRNEDFEDDAPDVVGHALAIGLEFAPQVAAITALAPSLTLCSKRDVIHRPPRAGLEFERFKYA